MESQNQEVKPVQNGSSTTLKVVVLVILIVLLVVGILLPIKLVPNAFNTVSDKISSWFSSEKAVELTANKTSIASGDEVTLSWNNAPKNKGTYSLSYTCMNGVEVQTSIVSPNEVIACNGNYFFSTATTSIALRIYSTETQSMQLPIALNYLENGSSTVRKLDDVVITVSNSNAPSTTPFVSPSPTTSPSVSPTPSASPSVSVSPKPTPSTSTSTSTITHAHRTSNPNGTPDLSVKIISSGYLSARGEFIPAAAVPANTRPAIKFVVTNIGDKNSGSWNFTASLPTPFNPTFTSNGLSNLGPDDSFAYVLGFDGLNTTRNNTVSITVDPSQKIGDTNRGNNYAQGTIVNSSY